MEHPRAVHVAFLPSDDQCIYFAVVLQLFFSPDLDGFGPAALGED